MLTGLEGSMNTRAMQKAVLAQGIITLAGFPLALLHRWEYSNSITSQAYLFLQKFLLSR